MNSINCRKSFTLVELVVVMLIVGILAAVSAPMMSTNMTRAKRTEAIVAMATIRTAERFVKAETGSYVNFSVGAFPTTAGINNYIKTGDLQGRYYNDSSYNVSGTTIHASPVIADSSLECSMDVVTGATSP